MRLFTLTYDITTKGDDIDINIRSQYSNNYKLSLTNKYVNLLTVERAIVDCIKKGLFIQTSYPFINKKLITQTTKQIIHNVIIKVHLDSIFYEINNLIKMCYRQRMDNYSISEQLRHTIDQNELFKPESMDITLNCLS